MTNALVDYDWEVVGSDSLVPGDRVIVGRMAVKVLSASESTVNMFGEPIVKYRTLDPDGTESVLSAPVGGRLCRVLDQ